jgi:hypothetical protein
MEVTPATEDDVPALSELLGVLFQQEAEFRPDPERQSAMIPMRLLLGGQRHAEPGGAADGGGRSAFPGS